jgi:hypothetical protein
MIKKMKDNKPPLRKGQISVISNQKMTPDQQASFLSASDALLIVLIQMLDRRIEGESDGTAENEVAW